MNRLDTLLSFHKDDPGDSFVRFALASEYRKLERLDDAIETFEALRRDDPDYLGTYYHLGKTYETAGRREEALDTYRRGIEIATRLRDTHARSELQSALLELEIMAADG